MVGGVYTEIIEVHQGALNRTFSRLRREFPI